MKTTDFITEQTLTESLKPKIQTISKSVGGGGVAYEYFLLNRISSSCEIGL